MENSIENPRGLISRISTLLNNEVCSDVVFNVRHNGLKGTFYAHSAILIAAGKGFLDLAKQTSQAKIIKVSEFSPHIVEMMLRYLYTDELNILSMENAADLYKLALVYHIDDLEKICINYITKEDVNIDNLFVKYESALSCKFVKLLEKCRNLVQSETKAVFESRYFGEAPFSVVEDMFSLDHLNVSSELDVIKAAFRWSEYECRRKGRPTEKLCIRDAIDPLLKHLRFLSVSADEFCDFTARDDNIFTSRETALLTRQILQPDNKGNFPEYLCPISKPRQPYLRTSNHTVVMDNFSDFYSEPIKKNASKDHFSVPDNKNSFQDLYSEPFIKNTFKDPYSDVDNKNAFKAPYSDPFLRTFSEPINRNNLNDSFSIQPSMNDFNDYRPESTISSLGQANRSKSGQDDPLFFRQSLNKTPSPVLAKTEQKPIFQYNQNPKKSTPMLKVMPQQGGTPTGRQIFDFPLQEMRKNIGFASSKDIKCNAKIQMRAGAILIHGIELKIAEQKYNPDDSIEVHSCISNNFPAKVETFDLQLKNSTLSIMYPEPLKVTPGNPTDIEITIEDLLLNRCFVCQVQNHELNCGLNVKAEISVKSNQSSGQDIVLYLISRIIYSQTSQF